MKIPHSTYYALARPNASGDWAVIARGSKKAMHARRKRGGGTVIITSKNKPGTLVPWAGPGPLGY